MISISKELCSEYNTVHEDIKSIVIAKYDIHCKRHIFKVTNLNNENVKMRDINISKYIANIFHTKGNILSEFHMHLELKQFKI